MPKVRCIFKRHARKFEYSAALDINLAVSVDQNVGNGRILQERFERSQSEDLVQHLAADSLLFRTAERHVRSTNQVKDHILYLRSGADILQ